MEHLFDKEDLEILGFEIPAIAWLGFDHDSTRVYDVVDFETYAILRGWNRDELERIKVGSLARPSVEVLSMLQSWCTFGFLEAACQQHFRSSDFITSENLFTTHSLRSFLRHKAKELRSKPDDELLPFLSNLADTQRTVHRWAVMLELKAIKTSEDLKLEEIASIIRVCTLLGEMLWNFERISSAECSSWPEKEGPGWYYSSANRHVLTERLTKKGWCPSTFGFLLRYSHSAIELASLIRPSDHQSGRHQGCTEETCTAYTIVAATYQTAHVDRQCRCEFIAAPFDLLESYLREGAIPVLNFDAILGKTNGSHIVSLENNHVTVFSHIWSDGLGGYAEKGLPECQVKRLWKMVADLNSSQESGRPSLAWIDSMCIPKREDLRSSAIRSMASIYREAHQTIVIDSSLLNFHPNRRPLQELAIRILSSTWMKRLWTLQEGALAKRLCFFLEGGDSWVWASWLLKVADSNAHCLITAELGRTLVKMCVGSPFKEMSLAAMLHMIPFRSCSRLDDETLALAPVMGLDVTSLLKARGDKRMVHFWMLLGQVPPATPFIPGQKLDIPGYRWALKSFATEVTTVEIWGEAAATVTSEGLMTEYLVVRFERPLEVAYKSIYHIRFESDRGGLSSTSNASRLAETSLTEKSDFTMTFMVTSGDATSSNIYCVGLALSDRFYPETLAILLGEDSPPQKLNIAGYQFYRYAGSAFLVPSDERSQMSMSGIVSLTKICLS
jgi:Heterokaryon incompatibility protein (HET)